MKTFGSKVLLGTAAVALAIGSVTPAMARDRRGNDGISAGEVIAGALIIGGIAAIVSSSNNDRDRYGDRYDYPRAGYDNGQGYYGDRYDRGNNGDSRQAVNQCVSAAEQRASGRYGYANVTQITQIDRTNRGYRVRGQIAADNRGGWDRGGRGGYDQGRFNCRVEYGRVTQLSVNGI